MKDTRSLTQGKVLLYLTSIKKILTQWGVAIRSLIPLRAFRLDS